MASRHGEGWGGFVFTLLDMYRTLSIFAMWPFFPFHPSRSQYQA